MKNDKQIIIGKFGKPFGIKGFVFVNSFTNPVENILNLTPWIIYKNNSFMEINYFKSIVQNGKIIIRLDNCFDRDVASEFVNIEIKIKRDQLPNIDENKFYWEDLIGLNVINKNGIKLGTIDHLFSTGANDIICVNVTTS